MTRWQVVKMTHDGAVIVAAEFRRRRAALAYEWALDALTLARQEQGRYHYDIREAPGERAR